MKLRAAIRQTVRWLPLLVWLLGVAGCHHIRRAAPARSGELPKLLWAWWQPNGSYVKSDLKLDKNGWPTGQDETETFRQDWSGAYSVGFVSPSSAVLVLPTGPVRVGKPGASPAWRFDSSAQLISVVRGVTGWFTGTRSTLPKSKRVPFVGADAIMYPASLPVPMHWYHGAGIRDVAMSPDGRRMALAVGLGEARCHVVMWNSLTGAESALHEGKRRLPIGAVTFSPSGSRLVVGYNPIPAAGPVCIVWNVKTGRPTLALSRQETWPGYLPSAIIFLPNHRLAITGGGKLLLANISGAGNIHSVPKPKGIVFTGATLALPNHNKLVLATRSAGGAIGVRSGLAICSARTGHLLRRISFRFGYAGLWHVTQLAASGHPHDVIVALTSNVDGGVGFFCEMDLKTGRMIWRSPEIIGGCTSIAVSPGGRAAITGGPLGAELWRLPADARRR